MPAAFPQTEGGGHYYTPAIIFPYRGIWKRILHCVRNDSKYKAECGRRNKTRFTPCRRIWKSLLPWEKVSRKWRMRGKVKIKENPSSVRRRTASPRGEARNRLLRNRLLQNRLLRNRLLQNRLRRNRLRRNRLRRNRLHRNRLRRNRLRPKPITPETDYTKNRLHKNRLCTK